MADPGQDRSLDDRPPDETLAESRADSLTRLKAFTDGTVAIALTLLVLPLVDVAGEGAGERVRDPVLELLADNAGTFFAFFLSFLVIARLWTAHRRQFALLRDFDSGVVVRLTLWLLIIVWLPFPTDLLFSGGELREGAAQLYLASLIIAGGAARWHGVYVAKRPHLLYSFVTPAMLKEGRRQGTLVLLVLLLCFAVSLFNEIAGLCLLSLNALVDRVPVPGLRRAPDAVEMPD